MVEGWLVAYCRGIAMVVLFLFVLVTCGHGLVSEVLHMLLGEYCKASRNPTRKNNETRKRDP